MTTWAKVKGGRARARPIPRRIIEPTTTPASEASRIAGILRLRLDLLEVDANSGDEHALTILRGLNADAHKPGMNNTDERARELVLEAVRSLSWHPRMRRDLKAAGRPLPAFGDAHIALVRTQLRRLSIEEQRVTDAQILRALNATSPGPKRGRTFASAIESLWASLGIRAAFEGSKRMRRRRRNAPE